MKAKKKEKIKSLNLAFYFGLFVFLIIVISLMLKTFDLVRKSKFDGNNRFSVAIMYKSDTDVVSISPKAGSLTKLRIKGVSDATSLRNLAIPVDSYVKSESEISEPPKLYFAKMLINKRILETDLSLWDLLKLSIYSLGTHDEKIREETASEEKDQLSLAASLFIDEEISEEKVSIQITNTTDVSGLGNKIAKYLTNMGANVVLVNSSKEIEGKSKIIYKYPSYTAKKISQILDLAGEEKETSAIADITIIIGRDKEGF